MGHDKQTKAMLASIATLAAFTLLLLGMAYATIFTISFVAGLIAYRLLVWFWLWYFDREDNERKKRNAWKAYY